MPGALVGPFGRYELGAESVTIGRSSSNKLVINDNQVSGRHLQVLPQGANYLLVDLGSSNGTTLNGQRLTPQAPQELRSGDVIVIGNTRLTIELAAPVFPAGPGGPAPQGEIIFAPPQQAGVFPPTADDPVFPPFPPAPVAPPFGLPATQGSPFPPAAPPPQAAPFPPPNYGAQPLQGPAFPPAAPTPQGPPFPPVGPPPQGAPFPSAGQGPTAFGPYTGDAPGQAPVFQPNAGGPWGAPPAFGGAPGAGVGLPPANFNINMDQHVHIGTPGAGVGLPPARAGAKRDRKLLLIGTVVALVVILGVSALVFLKFTGGSHSTTQATPLPTTPSASQQVIMPFYEDLKKQDYTAAARLFTASYLTTFGGVNGAANELKTLDATLGQVMSYNILSIKPASGSSQTTQTAMVQVTRAPVNGATRTFKPDILELVLDPQKHIWQIDMRTPGQPK